MSKKRDHLNDCLERLVQGEELESCLKDYPEEAEELRLLLKTADEIRRYAETTKPRPQFIVQTRAKLEMAYQQKYYSGKIRTVGILKPVSRLVTATALAIATLVVTFTGGFALSARASENTMPGETLYPVKLVTEQVRLTFAFSDDRRVSYLIQFAETRAEEIAYAAAKGDSAQVKAALERLEGYLAKVSNIVGPGQISGEIATHEYEPPELQRIESIMQASSARVKAKLEEIKEPATEINTEQPAPEKTEQPIPEKTEQPAPENKTEQPVPGKKTEEPASEKAGQPVPEKKPEEPAPEKKDKIIDRVDKAYSKTIEAIESAKGDKGNKPDKTGK